MSGISAKPDSIFSARSLLSDAGRGDSGSCNKTLSCPSNTGPGPPFASHQTCRYSVAALAQDTDFLFGICTGYMIHDIQERREKFFAIPPQDTHFIHKSSSSIIPSPCLSGDCGTNYVGLRDMLGGGGDELRNPPTHRFLETPGTQKWPTPTGGGGSMVGNDRRRGRGGGGVAV